MKISVKRRKRAGTILTVLFAACLCVGTISSNIGPTVNAQENATPPTLATEEIFEKSSMVTLETGVASPSYITNGWAQRQNLYQSVMVEDKFYTFEDTQYRYVSDLYTSGMKATFSQSKTTLTLKNPIDISKVTKDTSLLDFLPMASVRGVADISKCTIKLEDTVDPNNYIAVVVLLDEGTKTHVSAYTDKIAQAGYRWGGKTDPTQPKGTTGSNAFSLTSQVNELARENSSTPGNIPVGTPANDLLVEPFSLHLDPSDSTVFLRKKGLHQVLQDGGRWHSADVNILCLTNENQVGEGNAFKGFTNNRAKLSFTLDSLSGSSAEVMFYMVNDAALNGDEVVDAKAPDLSVLTPSVLPTAIPNKAYKFFDYIATDDLSGNCVTSIYVKEPNGQQFYKWKGDSFTPNKAGTYTIRYETVDRLGNKTYKDFSVLSSWSTLKMSIIHEELAKREYLLGEQVQIPDYTVEGGTGNIQSGYAVYRIADGAKIDVNEKGNFIPNVVGEYEIRYFAEDYVGDITEKSLIIRAYSNNTPAIEGTLNVSSVFLHNQKVQLPTVKAVDYDSISGVEQNAKLKITVSGNGQSEVLGEDRTFVPDMNKFGEEITISYKYYCEKYPESDGWVKNYNCKIKEAKKAWDYFDYADNSYQAEYNTYQQYTSNSRFIRFALKNSQSDAKVSFINPLKDSTVMMNFEVENRYQNFEALRFTFTDENNADIGFFVDIKKHDTSNSKSQLMYNGETFVFDGAFNSSENIVIKPLSIGYADGYVVDEVGTQICKIRYNFNGSVFTGFPSEYCKVAVSFVNPTVTENAGAGITIKKVANQTLYASYDDGGNLIDFEDVVRPLVVYNYDPSIQYTVGDKVLVPMAYAADVLSDYMEVQVSVTDPNFNNIVPLQTIREDLYFTIEKYGNYIIEYFTKDSSGKASMSSAIYVSIMDKIAPTVTIANKTAIEGKVGEGIALPSVIALDNYSETVNLICIVENDRKVRTVIDMAEGFVADTAGTYQVIFYAIDENFNATFDSIQIIVKE